MQEEITNMTLGMSKFLYHLGLPITNEKGESNFAPVCLTTGSKGRTRAIGQQLDGVRFWGDDVAPEEDRGLLCCTGEYKGVPISCFSSGMGGPSLFITMREAVMAGARIFIRVGSGGAISRMAKVGQVIVGEHAFLWDGASACVLPSGERVSALNALSHELYFSPVLRMESNPFITKVLKQVSADIAGKNAFGGTEFSTADFWTEQARENLFGIVPKSRRGRYDRAETEYANPYYSMELGPGLAWCKGEGGGLPMGAITTIYAERSKSEAARHADDKLAIQIALEAAVKVYGAPEMEQFVLRNQPQYS